MQRHLLTIGVLGAASILALMSCRIAVLRPLEPVDVLRQTILTNATTPALDFQYSLTVTSPDASGSFVGSGSVFRGSSAWVISGLMNIDRKVLPQGSLSVFASAVSPRPGISFLRIDSFSGSLANILQPTILPEIGRWKLLSSQSGSHVARMEGSSLDPTSINAVLRHINVTNDRGILRSPDGVDEYRYEVQVTDLGAPSLRGELSIDARRFLLRRAVWNMTQSGVTLQFVVNFSVRVGPRILPPVDVTDEPALLEPILNTILPSSLLPQSASFSDTERQQ